ncbi:MAG: hypothetical protein OQL09_05395, partial [Gammaproteobacteria bacterium]|nr:hypothetical protein [Gammaproteobacteria bacterium]
MKQSDFESKYNEYWEQIDGFLNSPNPHDIVLEINDNKLDVAQVYRNLCHHLSISRARHYSPSLVRRLEGLVMRFHQQLYKRKTHFLHDIVYYFSKGFPKAVRKDKSWIFLSAVIFFGSLLMVFLSIQFHPDIVLKIIDGYQLSSIEEMYKPDLDKIGRNRESDTDFQMFG